MRPAAGRDGDDEAFAGLEALAAEDELLARANGAVRNGGVGGRSRVVVVGGHGRNGADECDGARECDRCKCFFHVSP